MYKKFVKEKVRWFGQFSLLFQFENKSIFVDPFNIPKDTEIKADYIFLTHSHFDHLSFDDIDLIKKESTKFFAPKDAFDKLKEKNYENCTEIEPNISFKIETIDVSTFPMYNINKPQYHGRENNWLGFLFKFGNINIYVSGDTERIPEMKSIKCDIAFLPIGQVYTMDSVEDAVEAAKDVGAKLAIPVHFGMYEGSKSDAEYFVNFAKENNIDSFIMNKQHS